MSLFNSGADQLEASGCNPFAIQYTETRPQWMRGTTLEAALMDGRSSLEVVGESHHQDALWLLAGGRRPPEEHVTTKICALLLAEEGNPYDANAVAVLISGERAGYLSRHDAERYRAGLLVLQEKHGKPIALEGVIAGGGLREDGPGRLGVFLHHDPEDFGFPRLHKVVTRPGVTRSELADVDGCDHLAAQPPP
jgi:hypothetical protein